MEKDRETLFSFDNYKLPEKKKLVNERQVVIKDFVDAINLERVGTKFKPVTGKSIALQLSHLSVEELYYFLSMCKDYKNRNGSFSKCFYGALKLAKKN